MTETIALGVELWNDSCAIHEIREAIENGAVGATSNPVIAFDAVSGDPLTWNPVLDRIIEESPGDTEDEIAWRLIAAVAKEAAARLAPIHRETEGRRGVLCVQVSPKLYRSAERMVEHGVELSALAPNVAIKVPSTKEGIAAMEELVARGIPITATVSFSVSQAALAAEAVERGLVRAREAGLSSARLRSVITIMIGRVDDHMKRVVAAGSLAVDPAHLDWAGIAVFKEARRVFLQRGFTAPLLAAAYRHEGHWLSLVGEGIIQSIPYVWWKRFNSSDASVRRTLDEPVDPRALSALHEGIPDFRRAYDVGGMAPEELAGYGASVHTLKQFLGGYQRLVELVRERMLR